MRGSFILMSVLLVATNAGFLLCAMTIFVRAYLRDRRTTKRSLAPDRAPVGPERGTAVCARSMQ